MSAIPDANVSSFAWGTFIASLFSGVVIGYFGAYFKYGFDKRLAISRDKQMNIEHVTNIATNNYQTIWDKIIDLRGCVQKYCSSLSKDHFDKAMALSVELRATVDKVKLAIDCDIYKDICSVCDHCDDVIFCTNVISRLINSAQMRVDSELFYNKMQQSAATSLKLFTSSIGVLEDKLRQRIGVDK